MASALNLRSRRSFSSLARLAFFSEVLLEARVFLELKRDFIDDMVEVLLMDEVSDDVCIVVVYICMSGLYYGWRAKED